MKLPANVPTLSYAPHSSERALLEKELTLLSEGGFEIPLIIGGKRIFTGQKRKVVMPHSHQEVLAEFHLASVNEMKQAVENSLQAKKEWESLSVESRSRIFLKAAELLSGPWRAKINAATMLGQSKNAYQAEIDSACELIDFLRFNVSYYEKIIADQPLSTNGVINRLEYRPLEGFVYAIAPFNFTAIAANLPCAPAMLGNVCIWKPSDTQMFSAYLTYLLLEEAGLPPGVINFVPADGIEAGKFFLAQKELAAVHFTGSTATFKSIWKTVAENIDRYVTYPRLVGETGGKDFVFAHASANVDALRTALTRGAFEYQGQKCSAASRAYLPTPLFSKMKDDFIAEVKGLKMGDVRDFRNFVNAVIDRRSFDRLSRVLTEVKQSKNVEVLCGGGFDDSKGFFIEPTVLLTSDPKFKTMQEELFGPVLTIYTYDEKNFDETLKICDETSPYALTGAVFSQDRYVLEKMSARLKNAAGNIYYNDKPTGAVVGQQPFGGARASGTNDKAGSYLNLVRFLSPRTVKETLVSPTDYRYPFMG